MKPGREPGDGGAAAAIIRAAADKAGLSRRVALAFAWIESRHNPRAAGDLLWHERDGGKLYRLHVLGQKRLANNPDRERRELWHSYGLFQLLACYHVLDTESPLRLYDPVVNAERGCAAIARLIRRTKGDVRGARLAYVGCGYDGSQCSAAIVARVSRELEHALEKFAGEAS
jgi:Transglycosylase SLT domain